MKRFLGLLDTPKMCYNDLMDINKQQTLLNTLKYPTLFMFGLCVAIVAASMLRGVNMSASLSGRTLNVSTEAPQKTFDAARVADGFTAPADTHVIFTVPRGIEIARVTLLGGELNDQKRYWGYCFSGNENANKQKGYTGRKLYDGRFFYSYGERHVNDVKASEKGLIDFMNDATVEENDMASEIEIFRGGETCYLMAEVSLPIGLDSDGDDVNDRLEKDFGSNPQKADSDDDSIEDGVEIFIMQTSPVMIDSDQDGLPDFTEDENRNGRVDTFETNARNPDSDRDGLCDGDGTGNRCPEGYTSPVKGEDLNQNNEVDAGETDPKRADSDGNGVNDHDQRWLQYDLSQ